MVVLQYIASPFWGGGEQYIYDLCATMKEHGKAQFVFVCQPGSDDDLRARFGSLGSVFTLSPRTKNGKFSYIEALRLASIIRREKVDVLHIHDRKEFFLCAYAKRLCMRPVQLVTTVHLIVEKVKSKPSWLWVYKQIDAFIFVSQKAFDAFLVNPSVRQSCRSVCVVRNSVRLHGLNGEAKREELPIVLYHGRICPEKGIVQLLQAIEPCFKGNYTIILAGEVAEESRSALEELLHQSRLKGYLRHIGFRSDCEALIAQCRIGILPSIVPEAASLAILEHMAMGSAVIASDNGSQPEFVTNGKEAVLLPPGKWSEWEKAIERFIGDESEARRMGIEARKQFEKEFDYMKFVDKIYAVYTGK